jgi:hypothetical protein
MTTPLDDPFDEFSDDDLDDATVEAALTTDPKRVAALAAEFGKGITVPTTEMTRNSIAARIDAVRHGIDAALIKTPEPARPEWLAKGDD